VGVFVNAGDRIFEVASAVELQAIQLHGDEPPAYLAETYRRGIGELPIPILRAFRCRTADLSDIEDYLREYQWHAGSDCERNHALSAVLLDAYHQGAYGGTGHALDWERLHSERSRCMGFPMILAGGLTATNVGQAIAAARPDGVDTASGVEFSPGKKDPAKVRAFIAAAKAAFANREPR
jgi:phosphoribosylanthranilate isomerase